MDPEHLRRILEVSSTQWLLESSGAFVKQPYQRAGFRVLLEGPADGPVILLSNSLASNLTMWDHQVAALTGLGLRVLRYDTRGHGGSHVTHGPYTLELLVDDAVGLLERLFSAAGAPLACPGDIAEGGNLVVHDFNGDASVNLSDAVGLLGYLFNQGDPPSLGVDCVPAEGHGTPRLSWANT